MLNNSRFYKKIKTPNQTKTNPLIPPRFIFAQLLGEKKQHLIVKLTQHCGAYVHPDPVMSLL